MAQYDPPLATALPRQSGSREIRYAHLLSGQPDLSQLSPPASESATTRQSADDSRLSQLEAEVASLREQIAELKAEIAALSIARS
jgi:uncharacterized protein YceH (UPF0502 family)